MKFTFKEMKIMYDDVCTKIFRMEEDMPITHSEMAIQYDSEYFEKKRKKWLEEDLLKNDIYQCLCGLRNKLENIEFNIKIEDKE